MALETTPTNNNNKWRNRVERPWLKRQQQMTQNGHGIVVCKTLRTIYTKFGTFDSITCKYPVAVVSRGPYERSPAISMQKTHILPKTNSKYLAGVLYRLMLLFSISGARTDSLQCWKLDSFL